MDVVSDGVADCAEDEMSKTDTESPNDRESHDAPGTSNAPNIPVAPNTPLAPNSPVAPNTWDFCSNAAVKRASRRLGRLYDDVLEPSGLRSTQFSLLTQIAYRTAPTLKELATALVMDQSALGHTLRPLLRDGLVELAADEKDRRAKRVRLTEEGKARQAEALVLWQDAQSRFDAVFGREEAEVLRRTLDRLSSDGFALAFTAVDETLPARNTR